MEWLAVKLMVFTLSAIAVDLGCTVIVPLGSVMLLISIDVLLREVVMGDFVLFTVQRDCLVGHVTVLGSTLGRSINLVEELIILRLYISHEFLPAAIKFHVILLISVSYVRVVVLTLSVEVRCFNFGAVDLLIVIELVVMRVRPLITSSKDIFFRSAVLIEVRIVTGHVLINIVAVSFTLNVLVVDNLLAMVGSVTLDASMLIGPEELLVGRCIWHVMFVRILVAAMGQKIINDYLLDPVGVMSDFLVRNR